MLRTWFHIMGLTVLLLSGCAWRTGQAEHYVGPILFRYIGPPDGAAHVIQVKRLGLSGEVGTQWGLSVGLSERIAITPKTSEIGELYAPIEVPKWSKPLSFLSPPAAERWNLSLLYLRGKGVKKPYLVRRINYGTTFLLGSEVNAMSIGVVSRTHLDSPRNTLSVLHFDTNHPLEARFAVWQDTLEQDLPVSDILKEVEP